MILTFMTILDPEQERRRLREFYSQMTEGELEKVAIDAAALTDVARQVLEDEINRRGLQGRVENLPTGTDEIDLRKLVTVRKFRDLPEALLAKGAIESAGIPCFMADDNIVRLDWFISNFVGGIKLLVDPENVTEATEVLDQPVPESFAVEGVGEYQQPHCPKCKSLDVTFQNLMQNKAWNCLSCGHDWEDDCSLEDDKN